MHRRTETQPQHNIGEPHPAPNSYMTANNVSMTVNESLFFAPNGQLAFK